MPSAARARWLTLAAAGALFLVVGAQAGLVWTSTSTLTTTGNAAAPVFFELGESASNARYIKSPQVSTNGTVVTADIKARAGSHIEVKDVFRINNSQASPDTVTLEGNLIVNLQIERFTWRVRDGATTLDVLDHKDVTPSATFTVPAGSSVQLDLILDTADGAGKNNARVNFDLRLVP